MMESPKSSDGFIFFIFVVLFVTVIICVIGIIQQWAFREVLYTETLEVVALRKSADNPNVLEVEVYKDGMSCYVHPDSGLKNVNVGDSIVCTILHRPNTGYRDIHFLKKKGN